MSFLIYQGAQSTILQDQKAASNFRWIQKLEDQTRAQQEVDLGLLHSPLERRDLVQLEN